MRVVCPDEIRDVSSAPTESFDLCLVEDGARQTDAHLLRLTGAPRGRQEDTLLCSISRKPQLLQEGMI